MLAVSSSAEKDCHGCDDEDDDYYDYGYAYDYDYDDAADDDDDDDHYGYDHGDDGGGNEDDDEHMHVHDDLGCMLMQEQLVDNCQCIDMDPEEQLCASHLLDSRYMVVFKMGAPT